MKEIYEVGASQHEVRTRQFFLLGPNVEDFNFRHFEPLGDSHSCCGRHMI